MSRSKYGYITHPASNTFKSLAEAKKSAKRYSQAWGRDSWVENSETGRSEAEYAAGHTVRKKKRRKAKRRDAGSGAFDPMATNPGARIRTRVVRKNSTTVRGYKSVTITKLADGRVQITGRK